MSLELLNAVKHHTIAHRPQETLKLRIGIHTGKKRFTHSETYIYIYIYTYMHAYMYYTHVYHYITQ